MKLLFAFVFIIPILSHALTPENSLDDRLSRVYEQCLSSRIQVPSPTFRDIPQGMRSHYIPSRLQTVLSPIYRGIFDHAGGIIQSLISDRDEVFVDSRLRGIGRIIRDQLVTRKINSLQAVCLSSCAINYLMEGDDDVFPTISMTLAVANGRGFCRHFTMAQNVILEKAGVKAEYGLSLDHMFLYVQNERGQQLIFDPTNVDHPLDCTFFYPVRD